MFKSIIYLIDIKKDELFLLAFLSRFYLKLYFVRIGSLPNLLSSKYS